MWNCWCEHNYSLPIYFAFHMRDTYFWCTVTLVCACVDALGVDWGSRVKEGRGEGCWNLPDSET